MSEAEYMDDDGGLLAEQDSYIKNCDDYDGDCHRCPHKYSCWNSDYRREKNKQY